jgi:two-component system LytT family response regulator
MSDIKALIIDDESPARQIIQSYLKDYPGITIIGECENGFEALKVIQESKPDLVFLDIQMPKIDGFELLEVMDYKPEIIFATAYDQYAIKAFERNVVDYLLKPFSKDRLIKAVEKAIARIKSQPAKTDDPIGKLQKDLDDNKETLERVVTRLGSKISVIPVDKIWYIEAQDDYVMIYSEMGNHLKEKTMKYFETNLNPRTFVRIHRSYIVHISQVTGVEPYGKETHLVILRNGAKLKASAEGYKKLREYF